MRYGMIRRVGGTSRTRSPSGRRHSMRSSVVASLSYRPHVVEGAFAEFLAHPRVVERLTLRSSVGFLALHGGLEPGTAEIAEAAASRSRASCYTLVQPGDLRWHVPSHHVDPDDAPW